MLVKRCVVVFASLVHLVRSNPNHRPSKHFDFTVTWEKYAQNGHAKDMLLVNGQSPGPLIEVNQGDWVVVKLNNKSKYNTTIHHHGMFLAYLVQ